MTVEDGVHAGLELVGGVHGGEAEVEQDFERARDDVGGAGAGLDVGHLPGGGRELYNPCKNAEVFTGNFCSPFSIP